MKQHLLNNQDLLTGLDWHTIPGKYFGTVAL